jgi:hypothetical protein
VLIDHHLFPGRVAEDAVESRTLTQEHFGKGNGKMKDLQLGGQRLSLSEIGGALDRDLVNADWAGCFVQTCGD